MYSVDPTEQYYVYHFKYYQGQMFRYYFFADNDSKMYVCETDQPSCITENKFLLTNKANSTEAKKLPQRPDYFVLIDKQLASHFDFQMHTAIELSGYDYKSSPALKPEHQSQIKTFAYFVGIDTGISVSGIAAAEVTAHATFFGYNGFEQTTFVQDIKFNEGQFEHLFENDLFQDQAGWFYVTINALTDYSIFIMDEVYQMEQQKMLAIPQVYSFHEAVLHAKVEINPNQYDPANHQTFGIVAFSQNQKLLKNIGVYASTFGFMGNDYNDLGDILPVPQYNSALSGLILSGQITRNISSADNFKTCNTERDKCVLWLTFSYVADFYMIQREVYLYQFQPMYIYGEKGLLFAHSLPASQTFTVNEKTNHRLTAVFNQMIQLEPQITNFKQNGYVFFIEPLPGQTTEPPSAIVQLYGQGIGVSMSSNGQQAQAMVSGGVNQYYYMEDATYFVNIQDDNTYMGMVGSHGIVELEKDKESTILNAQANVMSHFYTNVRGMTKYQACASIKMQKGDGEFKIYASNNRFSPNPQSKDFESTLAVNDPTNKRYCVSGTTNGNTYAYFTVEYVSGNKDVVITVGEPQHYLQTVLMDDQTHFFEENTKTVMLKLRPPFYMKKGASFVQKKMYFEVNLMDVLTEPVQMEIADLPESVGQRLTYLTAQLAAGKTYFGKKVLLPIDKDVCLTLSVATFAKLRGHIFFSYVIDEPQVGVGFASHSSAPMVYQFTIEAFYEPVMMFKSDATFDLRNLEGWICKGQPKLSLTDQYAKDCQRLEFKESIYQTFAFSVDSELTSSLLSKFKLSDGSYYFTVFPTIDMPSRKQFAYELTNAIPIQTNKPTPVTLRPDPLLSALGYRNESLFIFDALILNDRQMSPEVTFKLDTVPLNICISMQPLTVAEMKARVKCEVSVYKEREISFQVPTSIFYAYTRLFVHVFGNQDLIKSCKKVQMSSFYSSTGQNMVQPKLFSNISRANEDKYQLKITSFSRQIEVSSQLNLAIVDYQALMEKGNADKTTLILADDPEFLKNVVRDDTKAIQVCRKEGYNNDTDKFFYVRVQLKTIETEPVKIKIIVQNQPLLDVKLKYEQSVRQTTTTTKYSTMYMQAIHTPIQLELEVCSGTSLENGKLKTYMNNFIRNPDAFTTATFESQFSTWEGVHQLELPAAQQDKYQYTNMNFFVSMVTEFTDLVFNVKPQVGSSRPSVPELKSVFVDKAGDQFTIRFRPAQLAEAQKFDGTLGLGLDLKPAVLKYALYAYEQLPPGATDKTECGLEHFATKIIDYQERPVDKNQSMFAFKYQPKSENVKFVLVAKNDNAGAKGATSVYKAVSYQEAGNTINVVGVTIGSIVGVCGVAGIILMVFWIKKIKKQRATLE